MIAITGSHTGFLSHHLLEAIPGSVSIPRDIRQNRYILREWLDDRHPTHLIHCAGLADVRRCMEFPAEAFRVNTMDTITLCNALHDRGIPLIYIATDKVYGDQEFCSTETPFRPLSAYDISKVAAELVVEQYARANKTVIARFPNFFGPGDPHAERLFPSVVKAVREEHPFFNVRTNAQCTRQYIFIRDAVQIICALTRHDTQRIKHNFGTPHIKSVQQIINDLGVVFGHHLIVQEQNLKGEASRLSMVCDSDLDRVALTPWEESLRSFLP